MARSHGSGTSPGVGLPTLIPYALTMFLGAFLLFQLQPIIARYILPWFGGTPGVWTTSMLFFQVMLLAGYGYAHLLASHLAARRQVAVHLALVAISLALLPITPSDGWKPDSGADPMLRIVLLLFATVGAPYFFVSSTAPLLQHWFSRLHPGKSPYRFYALSNAGSLLGLMSYPLLVEPHLRVSLQTLIWSIGYGLFALLSLWCAVAVFRLKSGDFDRGAVPVETRKKSSPADRFMWLALAGCAVVVLLAATNQISKDVAVIPLLWILPLALYLLSFIVSFGKPEWYRRPVWVAVLAVSLVSVVYLVGQDYAEHEIGLYWQLLIYSAAVFALCMVCHGELFRLRPEPSRLTSFYLMVALGGALGGAFVNLVAPHIFKGFWEFHASLLATVLLLGIAAARDRDPAAGRSLRVLLGGAWALSLLVLGYFLLEHIRVQQEEAIETRRNFYGVLRVTESDAGTDRHQRSLYHGRISHGMQFLDEELAARPTSYYGTDSGVGRAIRVRRQLARAEEPELSFKVGVIGLGAATIAAYGLPGDSYRFYEINPDVARIAAEYFTYLEDSDGDAEVVLGDARISLERELKNGEVQGFDVLAVDAFSGDAIPIHLLTREAFELYWEHLRADGVLTVHISNLHFDLRPVVRGLAEEMGRQAVWIEDDGRGTGEDSNDWVVVSSNQRVLTALRRHAKPWPESASRRIIWTDDYSNLLATLWRNE